MLVSSSQHIFLAVVSAFLLCAPASANPKCSTLPCTSGTHSAIAASSSFAWGSAFVMCDADSIQGYNHFYQTPTCDGMAFSFFSYGYPGKSGQCFTDYQVAGSQRVTCTGADTATLTATIEYFQNSADCTGESEEWSGLANAAGRYNNCLELKDGSPLCADATCVQDETACCTALEATVEDTGFTPPMRNATDDDGSFLGTCQDSVATQVLYYSGTANCDNEAFTASCNGESEGTCCSFDDGTTAGGRAWEHGNISVHITCSGDGASWKLTSFDGLDCRGEPTGADFGESDECIADSDSGSYGSYGADSDLECDPLTGNFGDSEIDGCYFGIILSTLSDPSCALSCGDGYEGAPTAVICIEGENGAELVNPLQCSPKSCSATIPMMTWTHTANAALSGYNDVKVQGTVDDCKTACIARTTCNSFDYDKTGNKCDLSDSAAGKDGVPSLKTNYAGNQYDHYALLRGAYGVASTAENNSYVCEDNTHGAICDLMCAVGYRGGGQATCHLGEWQGVNSCDPSPCESDPEITHINGRSSHCENTASGSDCAISCDLGFVPEGATTCTLGEFSGDAFCEGVVCAQLVVTDGDIVYSGNERSYGSYGSYGSYNIGIVENSVRYTKNGTEHTTTASVQCDGSRKLNARSEWTCGHEGKWIDSFSAHDTASPGSAGGAGAVVAFECQDLCAELSEFVEFADNLPKGASVDHCTLGAGQKTCSISACKVGYTTVSNSTGTVVCDDSNDLLTLTYVADDNTTDLTCTVSDVCSTAGESDLPTNFPEDVVVDFASCGLSDSSGHACTYEHFSCAPGSELSATGGLACDKNGEQAVLSASDDDGFPTCSPVACEAPASISNGEWAVSSEQYPSAAKITCDDGYVVTGDATYDCDISGQFSDIDTSCVGVSVQALPAFAHGVFSFSPTYPSTAKYTCDDGFELRGDATRIANTVGVFLGVPPVCSDLCSKSNTVSDLPEGVAQCATSAGSPLCSVSGCANGYSGSASGTISCDIATGTKAFVSYGSSATCVLNDYCAAVSLDTIVNLPPLTDTSSCDMSDSKPTCVLNTCKLGYTLNHGDSDNQGRVECTGSGEDVTAIYLGSASCVCGLEGPCLKAQECGWKETGASCNDGNTDSFIDTCSSSGVCAGIVPCDSDPCKNGGTCKNAGDQKIAFPVCECEEGYIGVFCEIMSTEEVISAGEMILDVNYDILISSGASIESVREGFLENLLAALNEDRDSSEYISSSQVSILETSGTDDSALLIKYEVSILQRIADGQVIYDARRLSSATEEAEAVSATLEEQVMIPSSVLMQGSVTGATIPESLSTEVVAVVEDCTYTEYLPWTPCSLECGAGVRKKFRSVAGSAANGGVACDTETLTVSEACNTFGCNLCETFDDAAILETPIIPDHVDVTTCSLSQLNTVCVVNSCLAGYDSNGRGGTIVCDISKGEDDALSYAEDGLFCAPALCTAGSFGATGTINCDEVGGTVQGTTGACTCACSAGYVGNDCATIDDDDSDDTSDNDGSKDSDDDDNIGIIVGCVVGGVAIMFIILGFVYYVTRDNKGEKPSSVTEKHAVNTLHGL